MDRGATHRPLCVVLKGPVGSGKTWAARQLAYRLAKVHLHNHPLVRNRSGAHNHVASAAGSNFDAHQLFDGDGVDDDDDLRLNQHSQPENTMQNSNHNNSSDDDGNDLGDAVGTMLPMFVVASRLEIVWHESQAVKTAEEDPAEKGGAAAVAAAEAAKRLAEAASGPSSPMSRANDARLKRKQQRQREKQERQHGGAATTYVMSGNTYLCLHTTYQP